MSRKWVAVAILVLAGVVSALGGVAGNVAADQLPTAWDRYLWLAWPLFGLFTAAGIGLAVWQWRAEKGEMWTAEDDGGSGGRQTGVGDYIAISDRGGTSIVTVIHQESGQRIPLQRPKRAEHFTGRDDELKELVEALQPGQVVTLCGPGGIGKTALAAEAIWRLAPGDEPPERFPDGIVFHSFYSQPEALAALEGMARAYGEEPRPDPEAAARRALSGREALLVLDGAENADDLTAVLGVAGSCGVVVTSRRREDARAGRTDLKPLPGPEAVALLQKWGGARAGDVGVAKRICELVGDLPLAVRLAGSYLAEREEEEADYLAWLQKTPLEALHHGRRQRESVPVLLERSVEQLSGGARQALGVMGVLALAPFGREAVAATLGVSTRAAGRRLGELVDYGLLVREDKRYQVTHPLVHTYARERMAAAPEVVSRLAKHYDALARRESQKGLAGYTVLDEERAHIMAVLEACVGREAWEETRELARGVVHFLYTRGYWTERMATAVAGLAAARQVGDQQSEGLFINILASANAVVGRLREAKRCGEQALIIAREIEDRPGEANALGSLGNVCAQLGQLEEAINYHEKALAINRRMGNLKGETDTLGNLGINYRQLGEVDRAISYYQQALTIARLIGDSHSEGHWTGLLGTAYQSLGKSQQALKYLEKALAIARDIGHRGDEGSWLGNLGAAYCSLGQSERAVELLQESLSIAHELGDPPMAGNALGNLGNAHAKLGDTEGAIDCYEQAVAVFREIGDHHSEEGWTATWRSAV